MKRHLFGAVKSKKKFIVVLQVAGFLVFVGFLVQCVGKSTEDVIMSLTKQQLIKNSKSFPHLTNDSVIIVVQVHKRTIYLRHLINSLSQADNISQALLIFSHDFHDADINELVQSISFCRVIQIFYPFSIQKHPNEFPGTDPNDCKRDMDQEEALEEHCNNALFPDRYGHYREASYTQTKHHWWWKANQVFDQLEATRYHTGLVLLLEEDHYVAKDFLHMINKMQKMSIKICPKCNIISLGTYSETLNNNTHSQIDVSNWISSQHNMGMAFNRSTWNDIKSCAKHFCSYDDYNWDWSLQFISDKCLKAKLFAISAKGPRVYHIGECNGLHHKMENCDPNNLTALSDSLRDSEHLMFPENLTLTSDQTSVFEFKENGGWSDPRDMSLCLKFCIS